MPTFRPYWPIAICLFACLPPTLDASAQDSTEDRPNVLWIMSEDNSKHYLELFDDRGAPTPEIAEMARHGVVFDRAFSNAPVCSVARTTLITSVYAPRLGTQFHRRIQMAQLPAGYSMFPALLRQAGYYTTNNSKKDYNAVEPQGIWDASSRRAHWRDRAEGQPFFHVQTFTDSHESSLHFAQSWADQPDNRTDPASVQLAPYHPDTELFRLTYARYHDRIGVIDTKVGRMIEELKAAGELENTFVFYFGDHGGVLPRGKGYAYESGLHVPLVVRVPDRWKSLCPFPMGSRSEGFVEFVDFGPTVLKLAGVKVPESVDGTPFLGAGITADSVESRDSTFGYADRMDEKYDLVRTLRVGNWKYIRNYQAIYPDGLQNNYRYIMLAYEQWRQKFRDNKLNEIQSAFFQRRPAEQLFDLSRDPDEVQNLADDPQQRERLQAMRNQLTQTVKRLPDLSFYPENWLVDRKIVAHPIEFGREHAADIARYVDIANLAVSDDDRSGEQLAAAMQSEDPLDRYWAYTAASAAGETDRMMIELATTAMDKDPAPVVRLRSAEFIGLAGAGDPMPTLRKLLAESESATLNLMILQTVVLFRDGPFDLDTSIDTETIGAVDDQTLRRLGYLNGWSNDEIRDRSRKLRQQRK